MNGKPMNGSWAAPHDAAGSPAFHMRVIEESHTRAQEAHRAAEPAADPWPDQPLDDLEQERARLEDEIATANARAAAAKLRTAARDAEVRSVLRADLVSSKESLVEIERRYEVTIAMVREAAQSEVAQILAAAHRSASGQRAAAASDQETGDHVE